MARWDNRLEMKNVDADRSKRFSAIALPHLDSVYNLARWLLRDDHSAHDAVQEAYMRGLRYFDSFHGGDARPWLLGIVRNCCYTLLKDRGRLGEQIEFDEERDSDADDSCLRTASDSPEQLLIRKRDKERVDRAIEGLPIIFREVIILRELEELSYEQIAAAAAIPLGTVMSRLARARAMLRTALSEGS
jgi:RNA polymerase sigma-70 factor (ECF subfamily)